MQAYKRLETNILKWEKCVLLFYLFLLLMSLEISLPQEQQSNNCRAGGEAETEQEVVCRRGPHKSLYGHICTRHTVKEVKRSIGAGGRRR